MKKIIYGLLAVLFVLSMSFLFSSPAKAAITGPGTSEKLNATGNLLGTYYNDESDPTPADGYDIYDPSHASLEGILGSTGESPDSRDPTLADPEHQSFGKGYYFDGDNDFLWFEDNDALDITDDSMTIEAWIRPDRVDQLRALIVRKAGGDQSNYSFFLDQDKLQFSYGDTGLQTSTDTVTVSKWNHVAVTYNGSTITFYINGSQVGSVSASNTQDGTQTGRLEVGGKHTSTTETMAVSDFEGMIDCVGINDNAMSQSDIVTDAEQYIQGFNVSDYDIVLKSDGTTSVTNASGAQVGIKEVYVREVVTDTGLVVVAVPIDFMNISGSWSDITAESDTVNGKSFIHGLSNYLPELTKGEEGCPSGTECCKQTMMGACGCHDSVDCLWSCAAKKCEGQQAQVEWYIPGTDTTDNLYICPDATSLDEVSLGCPGEINLSKNTTNGTYIVDRYFDVIGGQTYFKVTAQKNDFSTGGGEGGTGGGSSLPEFTVITIIIAGLVSFVVFLIVRRRRLGSGKVQK